MSQPKPLRDVRVDPRAGSSRGLLRGENSGLNYEASLEDRLTETPQGMRKPSIPSLQDLREPLSVSDQSTSWVSG